MTILLDGNKIAEEIKSEIKERVAQLVHKPKLAVILVGDNAASKVYVKKKCAACEEVGITSVVYHLNEEHEVRDIIKRLNADWRVDGILVQLPLPADWDLNAIFDLIDPYKDVDVFNPENVGLLVQNRPRFLPPTPAAVQQICKRSNLQLSGKHVVVINRSNIVGKPLSSMLIQDNGIYDNATVTVCHNNTPPEILKQICLSADVIVVAVGIPNFLTAEMVKKHQIVIDVGITRVGKKIVGDVHSEINGKVAYLTPVPGGVGPVTIACLLKNSIIAHIKNNYNNVIVPTI